MIWQDYMEATLADMPRASLPISTEPIWRKQEKILDTLLRDIEEALP